MHAVSGVVHALTRHRYGIMTTLDSTFEALADPVRRTLMRRLAHGPGSAGELAQPFEISRPAISRHLRVLRDAGLVQSSPIGRERVYELSSGGLSSVQQWLEEVSATWDQALPAFKRHVEAR